MVVSSVEFLSKFTTKVTNIYTNQITYFENMTKYVLNKITRTQVSRVFESNEHIEFIGLITVEQETFRDILEKSLS